MRDLQEKLTKLDVENWIAHMITDIWIEWIERKNREGAVYVPNRFF
jgi:hypothetical protein